MDVEQEKDDLWEVQWEELKENEYVRGVIHTKECILGFGPETSRETCSNRSTCVSFSQLSHGEKTQNSSSVSDGNATKTEGGETGKDENSVLWNGKEEGEQKIDSAQSIGNTTAQGMETDASSLTSNQVSLSSRVTGATGIQSPPAANQDLFSKIRHLISEQMGYQISLSNEYGQNLPFAYARITGKDFEAFMLHPHMVLGRVSPIWLGLAQRLGLNAGLGRGAIVGDCHLGNSPTIAPKHAKVDWDKERKFFTITCLSPLGLSVDDYPLMPAMGPYPLPSRSTIRIGDRILYFCAPEQSNSRHDARHVMPRFFSANDIVTKLLITIRDIFRLRTKYLRKKAAMQEANKNTPKVPKLGNSPSVSEEFENEQKTKKATEDEIPPAPPKVPDAKPPVSVEEKPVEKVEPPKVDAGMPQKRNRVEVSEEKEKKVRRKSPYASPMLEPVADVPVVTTMPLKEHRPVALASQSSNSSMGSSTSKSDCQETVSKGPSVAYRESASDDSSWASGKKLQKSVTSAENAREDRNLRPDGNDWEEKTKRPDPKGWEERAKKPDTGATVRRSFPSSTVEPPPLVPSSAVLTSRLSQKSSVPENKSGQNRSLGRSEGLPPTQTQVNPAPPLQENGLNLSDLFMASLPDQQKLGRMEGGGRKESVPPITINKDRSSFLTNGAPMPGSGFYKTKEREEWEEWNRPSHGLDYGGRSGGSAPGLPRGRGRETENHMDNHLASLNHPDPMTGLTQAADTYQTLQALGRCFSFCFSDVAPFPSGLQSHSN